MSPKDENQRASLSKAILHVADDTTHFEDGVIPTGAKTQTPDERRELRRSGGIALTIASRVLQPGVNVPKPLA